MRHSMRAIDQDTAPEARAAVRTAARCLGVLAAWGAAMVLAVACSGAPSQADSTAQASSPLAPVAAATTAQAASPAATAYTEAAANREQPTASAVPTPPATATPLAAATATSTPAPTSPPATATRQPIASPTAAAVAAAATPHPTPATPAPSSAPVAPAATAPAVAANVGRITAVGDSVMLGAAPELRQDLGAVDVDAAVSRQVAAGINVLAGRRASGQLAPTVVIHLGTNGTFTAGEFDQMMQILKGERRIVFVNIRVDRSWEPGNNVVIADGVRRYGNTRLVDWHDAASSRAGLFANDGFHLRPDGAALYAGMIASAVASP